ncbi:tRNA (adenosine(37)-N6)-threonylcarbamoyltransferase complex dimerization subunit type 1 TsaB [Patescibacteria group bacterium]|nr:tRNA (adenosine(37)-N6)-threonylcarbamoyltransferase complex dimerization subunit type 1 TsaB [Patescibacteria group bacterium]
MFLCIDTTTSKSGVTLVGDKIYHEILDPQNASEQLIGAIDRVIKESGLQLSDLQGIFVIRGPGSYTGLRVGIAVANQFAHQLKIPIVGLKTDEWWNYRTDEKDFIYLQSMNKEEVYISELGSQTSDPIVPIQQLSGAKKWLGELSDEHRQKLPTTFMQITNVLSPEETWAKVVQTTKDKRQTTYALIEPYYGKEPTITKSKKKLTISDL